MHIPEDFIPDFTCKFTTGAICNRYSLIQCFEQLCYISLQNKLNVWNLNSAELIESFGTRESSITAFLINDKNIFIGYEDGSIELIFEGESKIIKLHTKKVSKLLIFKDMLLSASSDGTVCCYDLVLEDIKLYFKGNHYSVQDILLIEDSKLCAVCADKCIKIWKLDSEVLNDAIVFDNYLHGAVARGNELLVFLVTGESVTVNTITKEKKPFERFKNIRNLMLKENVLCVQTQRKTVLFECPDETFLTVQLLKRIETSADFFNFDLIGKVPCFISKQNKVVLENRTLDFGFHSDKIIGVISDKSRIYSLSKEKLVCWNREVEKEEAIDDEEPKETLILSSTLEIKDALCFCHFADQIVIGTSHGLVIVNKRFFEIKDEIKIGKVTTIAASENALAACTDRLFTFFDKEFQEIKTLLAPETVVYSRFSIDGSFFFCSCLDNKIYQFVFKTLELRITLYGHSLPVRHFSVSSDEKLLISCGADKLVKLWGLDFGECRKTIIGDSISAEFFNDTLFVFSGKNIEYYNYFTKLRKFKAFEPGVICPGTDYFVASVGKGLVLFGMNKYEFAKEEESSDIKELAIKNIISVKNYDMFLDYLQLLENEFSEINIQQLYLFIEKLDFNELKEYLYVVDRFSVKIMLDVILHCIDMNLTVNSRLFMELLRNHKEIVIGTDVFFEIHEKLLQRISKTRDLYNKNAAKLDIDLNDIQLDLFI
ncbi:hypothetical protein GINT2_001308 [Glugoides intestinalis]